MKYKMLIDEVEKEKIDLVEIKLSKRFKGLYCDNVIAINKDLSTYADRTCILAEELGHYHTTTGDILDQNKIENRKQELKARRWAVDRLIRVEDFIDAYTHGVRNRAELAEYLEVTEEFIHTAIDHFKGIYGYSHQVEEYTIIFEPLIVCKAIE